MVISTNIISYKRITNIYKIYVHMIKCTIIITLLNENWNNYNTLMCKYSFKFDCTQIICL